MNKTKLLSAIAMVSTLTPAVSSAAFLNDWKLNLDGGSAANAVTVSEFLDFVGPSYIQNTINPGADGVVNAGDSFTFKDNGAFNITSTDGGTTIASSFLGYEMTGLFTGGTGTGTLGGGINFNAGGLLELYSQNLLAGGEAFGTNDAGNSAPIYGANDGTHIATFTQVSGSGLVDPTGIPNGQLTLVFKATSLAAGYWFDKNGIDLSTLVGLGEDLLFGFVTTNASYVANPSASVIDEIVGDLAGAGGTYTNIAPVDFVVSNNGQFRLTTVPEPGSLALLGLGFVALSRFKKIKAA